MTERLKLGSKMREIPLREEDRLKLADKPLAEMSVDELVERFKELRLEESRIKAEVARIQHELRRFENGK